MFRFSTLLLSVLVGSACSRVPDPGARKSDAAPTSAELREVETATAGVEPWERTLPAVGDLAAFDEATISTKVPGRLVELAIDLGSEIEARQVVARIDRRDYELAVAAAEAALRQARARLGLPVDGDDDLVDPEATGIVRQARAVLAQTKANHERIAGLRKQGVSSHAEQDEFEAAFRVAESRLQDALEDVASRRAQLVERRAALAIARAALSDADIQAPFDGVTLERIAGLGNFLRAGDPIARVARIDPLRLRLEIPERESALVRVGQPVRLSLEGDPRMHAGTIARISPGIDPRNRALTVEAEIPNARARSAPSNGHAVSPDGDLTGEAVRIPTAGSEAAPVSAGAAPPANGDLGLRPGAFARAEIVIDSAAEALTVPLAAVTSFAGIDKVIAIEDGKTVEKRVKLGRRDGARVEVLDGLQAGAEVVLSPGTLQSGQPVRVTR